MIAIGLRVYSNSTVYYCIIDKKEDNTLEYLQIAELKLPTSLILSEALSYIRNTLKDIFAEYNVSRAVIRLPEYMGTVKKITIERFYIEGVIQEALASSNIEKHLCGQIAELTRVAGIEKTEFKKLAKGESIFDQYPNSSAPKTWEKLKLEQRESILACYTALNL